MSDMSPKLHLSSGPHIRRGRTTTQIMWMVNLALLPALVWSFFIFGIQTILITVIATLGSVVGEAIISKLMKKKMTITDGSAVCTGMLLAYTLPPGIPVWMPFIGSLLAIILAKGLFGGLGYNLFNIALIGRALMMATFPVEMTTKWLVPKLGQVANTDGVTMATPLAILKEKGLDAALNAFSQLPESMTYFWRLIIGLRPGSIGEVSVVCILLGAAFLYWKGIIKLHIPISCLVGLGIVAAFNPGLGIQMFSGGIWLGAFFMATDYVTSPTMPRGQIIFGLGVGLLTGIIRVWGGYPEGVCYAILLMNTITPALDEWFPPKRISTMGVPS